jgi:4-carboxymuconolactone decarboxylase
VTVAISERAHKIQDDGNDRQLLLTVITQLLHFIGYPRNRNALRVINEVTTA